MYRPTRVEVLDKPHDRVVSLGDLIGGADLVRMYQFNYMHDIPWVISHTVSRPESHFVYGYHGRDLEGPVLRRQAREVGAEVHGVRLAAPYGTHHSKMMVLFFRDGTCRVVVHTANMIEFDWANMTQGVWQTGRLRRSGGGPTQRFRAELRRYLSSYGLSVATALGRELGEYDFGAIDSRFQLIASVPGNYMCRSFGLRRMRVPPTDKVVVQVSSIASLPAGYLDKFRESLRTKELEIVFPTVGDVAGSLNGYGSGAAIHLKRESAAQRAQYELLRPLLRRWRSLKAGRQLAAPHIKSYVGLVGHKVSWVLLTSANLSKQAWGVANKRRGTEWIQSWELGVLEVFDEPQDPAYYRDGRDWFLAYDLPTVGYGAEEAWSAQGEYPADVHGRAWPFSGI